MISIRKQVYNLYCYCVLYTYRSKNAGSTISQHQKGLFDKSLIELGFKKTAKGRITKRITFPKASTENTSKPS